MELGEKWFLVYIPTLDEHENHPIGQASIRLSKKQTFEG